MADASSSTITRILFLAPRTQLELCEDLSEYLRMEIETANHSCHFRVFNDSARALKAIDDQSPDIVIASNRIEESSVPSCFPFLSQLNKRCPNTLKILIVENTNHYPDEINKTIDQYFISHVFLRCYLKIDELANSVIQLLNVTEYFPNGYALLVGVGGDPPFTTKNIQAVYKTLTNPSIAAYYPSRVDDSTEVDASKENIIDSLRFLALQTRSNAEAIVSIFFSGYGGYLQGDQYFFVTSTYFDNDPEEYENALISIDELCQEINKITARKIILWFDWCYEGGLCPEGEMSVRLPPVSKLASSLIPGRYVIVTSSSDGETSQQTANGYSIFTHCLLEALRGRAGQQSDDYIYMVDVLRYLEKEVNRQSSRPQNPITIPPINQIDEDFPLCHRSKLATVSPLLKSGIDGIRQSIQGVPSTRSELYRYIIELPEPQLKELLFRLHDLDLGLPRENIPGSAASRSERVGPLMEWVESPIGCGLEGLRRVLKDMFRS